MANTQPKAKKKIQKFYENVSGNVVGKYVSPYPIKLSDSMPDSGLEHHGKPIFIKNK